jgi:hypothetical protein
MQLADLLLWHLNSFSARPAGALYASPLTSVIDAPADIATQTEAEVLNLQLADL